MAIIQEYGMDWTLHALARDVSSIQLALSTRIAVPKGTLTLCSKGLIH